MCGLSLLAMQDICIGRTSDPHALVLCSCTTLLQVAE